MNARERCGIAFGVLWTLGVLAFAGFGCHCIYLGIREYREPHPFLPMWPISLGIFAIIYSVPAWFVGAMIAGCIAGDDERSPDHAD